MNNYSFQKGYSQVRRKDAQVIKAQIMNALGISTRAGWAARLNGHVEPKVSEAKAIEDIFRKYGINQIWGNE